MRRLAFALAALAAAAGPLAAGGEAMAKDHREAPREGPGPQRAGQGRWGGGERGGGERGGPAYRGEEYRGGYDPRMDPRGGGYRYEQAPQRVDPRYDPRAYAAPPNAYRADPRRGGYGGPGGGGGEVIQDPGRYRLRAAPRGYEWVRTPRGAALVSQSTGQVFDVVPY